MVESFQPVLSGSLAVKSGSRLGCHHSHLKPAQLSQLLIVQSNYPAKFSEGHQPHSVTSIGYGAFSSCTNLTNIAIPNSVTNIGTVAFPFCTGLTNVGIPNTVTSIGSGAFNGCSSLTSVTIPNGITSIAAFGGCSSLTSITIPPAVTNIGASAFYDCTGLTNITIPNSVTRIGIFAFSRCTSLTGIYFQGNAPSLGSGVFSLDKTTIYYLLGSTGWASAFGGLNGIITGFWILPYPVILNGSFGVRSNQFGFTVSWATYAPVVVEATTSLSSPVWQRCKRTPSTTEWLISSTQSGPTMLAVSTESARSNPVSVSQ